MKPYVFYLKTVIKDNEYQVRLIKIKTEKAQLSIIKNKNNYKSYYRHKKLINR